jgi:hypothetical protein
MQGNIFVLTKSVPGTLTANASMRFKFPFGATLIGANAYTDNALTFILDFGTAADPDAYIDEVTITGATGTTTEIAPSSFVDGAPVHIPAGTECLLSIDYDGGGGNDSANVDVHLFFREG